MDHTRCEHYTCREPELAAGNTPEAETIGKFSGACFMVSMPHGETGPVCGPAFYSTEPIDPELFADQGPAGQVVAASMPTHDVYISPPRGENGSAGEVSQTHPVHLLAWDVLIGVLFFASGKPPVPCR